MNQRENEPVRLLMNFDATNDSCVGMVRKVLASGSVEMSFKNQEDMDRFLEAGGPDIVRRIHEESSRGRESVAAAGYAIGGIIRRDEV